MTEEEWQTWKHPPAFLDFLKDKDLASKRKLRLLAVSCCRQLDRSQLLEEDWKAVEIAEQFADGSASSDSIRSCFKEPATEKIKRKSPAWWAARLSSSVNSANQCMFATYWYRVDLRRVRGKKLDEFHTGLLEHHDRLIRDIFGNPFHPVAFDPRWRTSDVVGLARAIYEDKAFERMPILADALMDAGCEEEQIIAHCRGDGPHVRGCWVVDLVLGKE